MTKTIFLGHLDGFYILNLDISFIYKGIKKIHFKHTSILTCQIFSKRHDFEATLRDLLILDFFKYK